MGQEVEPDVGFGWGWQRQDRRSSRGCRLDVVCHAYVRGFDAQTGVVVAMAIGRRYQDLRPACLLVPFCPTTHPDVLVTAIQPSLSYIMFLCRSRSPFPSSALSLLLSLLPVVELGSVGLGLLSCEMAADIESLSGFYSLGVPELRMRRRLVPMFVCGMWDGGRSGVLGSYGASSSQWRASRVRRPSRRRSQAT